MPEKVVLVTGADSGIGLAVAIAAATAGDTVVAAVTDPNDTGTLHESGLGLDVRRMNVTEADSIASCVAGVASTYGRLDALVNTVATGWLGTAETMPMADVRRMMEVNYFGLVETTRAVMPLLRASGGRIVTVTSVAAAFGQPFREAYCASMCAVEGFLQSLAPVAASVGVAVSVVQPSSVAAGFVTAAASEQDRLLASAGPYGPALQAYVDQAFNQLRGPQAAEEIADVIGQALAADPPVFRWQTSAWARDFVSTSLADSDGSRVRALTDSWLLDAGQRTR